MPIAAGLTDLQGLVHAPGAEWDPRELLKGCGIAAWQFDHLVAGQKPFERYQVAQVPSPVIDLTPGADAYFATLKKSSPNSCQGSAASPASSTARWAPCGSCRTRATSPTCTR